MAIEGPLKELEIHDVFQLLDLNRKTGVLTVTSPLRQNRGAIYFDRGAITYASIQTNPHPLGKILIRNGKIAEADLRRARDMQQGGDTRRLGEILVSIGAIAPRELDRHVCFQVEEVVFEILNWREGYFSFVEGPLKEIATDATVQISTQSLLMEGARRIDEWSRIEKKIPDLAVVPSLAPAETGAGGILDLLPADWEVVALIDGEQNLREIARGLGRSEFEVAKTVFGLESTGIVMVAQARRSSGVTQLKDAELHELLSAAERAIQDGRHEEAERHLEQARARFSETPEVYVMAGRLHLSRARPGEAESQLRRALRLDPLLGPAHRLLGHAAALQGRLGEAVEWWQRWLRLGEQEENGGSTGDVRGALQAAQMLDAFLKGTNG